MQRYDNSDSSGVQMFEEGVNSITLEFADGTCYLYNDKKPGKHHIEAMLKLAHYGRGLATYINKHIRNNYFRKLK